MSQPVEGIKYSARRFALTVFLRTADGVHTLHIWLPLLVERGHERLAQTRFDHRLPLHPAACVCEVMLVRRPFFSATNFSFGHDKF